MRKHVDSARERDSRYKRQAGKMETNNMEHLLYAQRMRERNRIGNIQQLTQDVCALICVRVW